MTHRALITGANRGIGYAIAKELAESGYDVLIAGRNKSAISQAAKQLRATPLLMDMADPASIEATASAAGNIDILINNAGILGSGSVLDSISEWQQSMATMVDGPFRLMHYLLPRMIENQYGRVVNISSGWGAFSSGVAGPGAYGVAKAALNALTVASARNMPANIKINAMCPGWVRTEMGGPMADKSPEEAAETAIWLATLDKSGPSGKFYRDKQPIEW